MPVIVKLPPIDFKVEPIEKVTRFAAVIVSNPLIETKAGKLKVVNAANDGTNVPVTLASNVKVTVVADAHTGENPAPNVVKAGKLSVANVAAVRPNAPVTFCKLVNVKEVNAARVGLNVPLTETKDGILIVCNNVPLIAKLPATTKFPIYPIWINEGRDKDVNVFAVSVKLP